MLNNAYEKKSFKELTSNDIEMIHELVKVTKHAVLKLI